MAEKFVFSLRGLGSGGEFGTVILTLTDSVNKEESVSVIIGEIRGKTTMTVSGNSVSPDFSFDGSKSLEISYADGAFFASGLSVSATYTDEGKPFKGFSSHKISLKMRFEKTGESSVYVERLCNQSFTGTVTRDVTSPEYYIRNDAGGVIEVGNYTLNAAYASDVLDPNVVFKVSVTDENGEFIKSIDGIELKDADPAKDYVVRFDKIGSYMVRYVVADTFNSSPNETVYSYSLTVEDKESPKIAINGEFKTTVKKGDVYVLPEFSVTDNCSASENIRIMKYVSDPSGRFVEIPANSNSFRVDYKGEYELRIMAVDEAGNVAYLCVKITTED